MFDRIFDVFDEKSFGFNSWYFFCVQFVNLSVLRTIRSFDVMENEMQKMQKTRWRTDG